MWTWWFIARDDEAPRMPDEEEGDRPALCFEADERELAALGVALGAAYEPAVVFEIDESRSIVRVPNAFVRKLGEVSDVGAAARAWRSASSIGGREEAQVIGTLTEMRDFAAEAAKGPGVLAYRET